MNVERAAPATVKELAKMSSGSNTLFFGIGTTERDELLCFTAANLLPDELLIAIDNSAGCLAEIETPEQTPAIGAWCSKGTLIDYAYDSQGVVALMKEARRFAS